MAKSTPFYSIDKDQPTPVECEIKGAIPTWLTGSLYRNGPAMHYVGDVITNHLFDGLAAVHIYKFENGNVMYQSRLLPTESFKRDMSAQRLVVGEFGTARYSDPCKYLFSRFFSYFFSDGESTDNTSVNLLETSDQLFALTETQFVNRIDPQTLDIMEKVDFSKIIALNVATAHPHQDPDGTAYNIGTSFKKQSEYKFVKIPPAAGDTNPLEEAELLGSIKSTWPLFPAYYHSFGMTENYIVFLEQPLAFNILKLKYSRFLMTSFKDALRFYPDEKAIFHILDKRTGKQVPQKYTTNALFVFHHINAYEEEGHIVVDLCGYDDASVVDELSLEHLMTDPSGRDFNAATATVRRFVLPLDVRADSGLGKNLVTLYYTSATARLNKANEVQCIPQMYYDAQMELPRMNYARYNGKKYNYVYGMSFVSEKGMALTKLDLTTGETKLWHDDPIYLVGEPVFVASPDATTEDDGVVLSPILSSKSEKPSFLVVLNAKDMSEIARAVVPRDVKVALTFHGIYTETFKK